MEGGDQAKPQQQKGFLNAFFACFSTHTEEDGKAAEQGERDNSKGKNGGFFK
jgi:hypothetical protein